MRTAFPHLGCRYERRSEFLTGAAEYIAEGLRRNQRIVYVGDRSRGALRAELTGMPGVGDGLKSGAVEIRQSEDHYVFQSGSDIIDAHSAVASYEAAADDAIAQGYSGFRAVVDVTPVARTPEQREALARLEYLVDQKIALLPFSAMCAYDTSELGTAAAELICLHPLVEPGSVAFQLHADPHGASDCVLTGEIDACSTALFATTLQRVWPLVASDPLQVDARALEFIGPEQLRVLDESARRRNRNVVLCSDQRIVTRLAELIALTSVTVAPVGDCRPDEGESAIEQVKGLLIETFGLQAQEAFAVLARFARITDTTVSERAERIRADLSVGASDDRRRATLDALKTIHDELRASWT